MKDDAPFHLRVILGQKVGQGGDRPAIEPEKSRGGVCRLLSGQQGDGAGKDHDADAARKRDVHRLTRVEEARADDHVSPAFLQHAQECGDLLRIVLTVAIQTNDVVVMVLPGKLQAGLHRAADAEVEGVTHDLRAGSFCSQPGLIGGAIIYY